MIKSDLIEAIAADAKSVGAIDGLYLSGSYGANLEDKYSDLDFVAIASSDCIRAVAQGWEALCRERFDVVFCRQQAGHSSLINIVTAEWLRIDLFVETETAFKKRTQDQLRCLFERKSLFDQLAMQSSDHLPNDDRLVYLAEEFYRVLGLVVVGLGRKEHFLCSVGLGLLRSTFMSFAVEVEATHQRGMLSLSQQVSAQTVSILNALPKNVDGREQIIDAHVHTAIAFIGYAKPVFAARGLAWPTAFEEATRRYLLSELGESALF